MNRRIWCFMPGRRRGDDACQKTEVCVRREGYIIYWGDFGHFLEFEGQGTDSVVTAGEAGLRKRRARA